MTNDRNRQLEKKCYEIAYALFRISGNLGGRPLSAYIENHALSLFDSAIYGNQEPALRESRILEYYLRLGGDTGLIHQDNVTLIISEIGKLNSEISELSKKSGKSEPEPEKLYFAGLEQKISKEPKLTADIKKKEIPEEVINKEIETIINREDDGVPEEITATRQTSNQSEIRQSEILEIIRKSGNLLNQQAGCRIRELQELFPDVSDRTLRYDLEKLAEKGLVERVGQAGPATFYTVKKGVEKAKLSTVLG